MTDDEPKDPRPNWGTLSQAERDAAYDNNKAVANSPALIAARNEASARVRASRVAALDIAYGNRERTKFDLYPAHDRSAPCLVFLHGGYWQRNSRQDFAIGLSHFVVHRSRRSRTTSCCAKRSHIWRRRSSIGPTRAGPSPLQDAAHSRDDLLALRRSQPDRPHRRNCAPSYRFALGT